MVKKAILTTWILLLVYAVTIAPKGEFDVFSVMKDFTQTEGLLFIIFNFMGLYPFIYYAFTYKKGIKALIICTISFFLGAFVIAPFIAFTKNKKKKNKKNLLAKFAENKNVYLILLLASIITLIYGLINADLNQYINLFQNTTFIHVMTFDFLLLWVLSFHEIKKDIMEKKLNKKLIYLNSVPVIGAFAYLYYSKTL